MNTTELMVQHLNKQIHANCKMYAVVLERPDGNTFSEFVLAQTAHEALKDSQERHEDCLVIQVTIGGKVAA